MISKEALIFQNRIKSFDEDLELIDILLIAFKRNDLLKENRVLFKYLDDKKHLNLINRRATDQSRRIVLYHLRKTVYSSYIKDLYEELSGYLKALLSKAAKMAKDKNNARRLLGEHSIKINAFDILQYDSIDSLASFIAESIIQALENERSTKELIKKVCNKIDLQINEKLIENAMPYLDLRHKLVHSNGVIDEAFIQKYPSIKRDKDNNVVLNHALVKSARKAVSDLVFEIDNKSVEKGLLSENSGN